MNVERLKQVRDVIASSPDQYDQGIFAHKCGTPACIAGWAASLSLKPGEKLTWACVATGVQSDRVDTIPNRAAMWLDLAPHDAVKMFDGAPLWVRKGDGYGYDEPTVQEALAMLNHAIETGEVVWWRVEGEDV